MTRPTDYDLLRPPPSGLAAFDMNCGDKQQVDDFDSPVGEGDPQCARMLGMEGNALRMRYRNLGAVRELKAIRPKRPRLVNLA